MNGLGVQSVTIPKWGTPPSRIKTNIGATTAEPPTRQSLRANPHPMKSWVSIGTTAACVMKQRGDVPQCFTKKGENIMTNFTGNYKDCNGLLPWQEILPYKVLFRA